MHWIDWTLIAIYLIVTGLIGLGALRVIGSL